MKSTTENEVITNPIYSTCTLIRKERKFLNFLTITNNIPIDVIYRTTIRGSYAMYDIDLSYMEDKIAIEKTWKILDRCIPSFI